MYLIIGIKHLLTPGLKKYIVLPLLFNFVLFASLFALAHHFLYAFVQGYIDQLPAWLSFLSTLFFIVMVISFFLLFLSMFTVLFNLVAAPLNGLLAEKAQSILYHTPIPNLSFSTIAWRSIKRQMQFLKYYLPRFFLMILLFFVPFIQPIYPLLWFFFNAWMLSMQYQDFVMDNNIVSFESMRQQMEQKRMLSLGLGTLLNFASFVPILNIITMPAAVIGCVVMYHEERLGNQKLTPPVLKIPKQ